MKKKGKADLKLEEIDFEPRAWIRKFLTFLFCYGFGVGYLTLSIVLKIAGNGINSYENLLRIFFITIAYFLVALFILFYGVFGQNRFKFEETGIKVLTWRGWQFFKWKSVETAFLTDLRRNVDLVLYARGRYLIIPLNSFKRSETLFREVVKRVNVFISATEMQLARIKEVGI